MLKLRKNGLTLVIVFYRCILKFYQNLTVFEREERLCLLFFHQMTENPRTSFLTAKEMDMPAALCET